MNFLRHTLFRSALFKWSTAFVLLVIAGLFALLCNTDKARYERTLGGITVAPQKWIGIQASAATFDSLGMSSKFIASSVDEAYVELCRSFSVRARTYYSECGDMPTQESIWQFNGYFVRLYATSALECDACSVGVFKGSYEDFRAEQLKPDCDPSMKFNLIEYQSPRRFLYPNR